MASILLRHFRTGDDEAPVPVILISTHAEPELSEMLEEKSRHRFPRQVRSVG